MHEFNLHSNYEPSGDQPKAIKELTEGILRGDKYQTLLGVTGSGKTFTISNVIKNVGKPTLVISPNKTLAAQLYSEFKSFFPDNCVEFFISYYDYYQPEAYIPGTDTYIEKDFAINDEIDRMRHRTICNLIENRRDVIVVASVSCIYSIGNRQDYQDSILFLKTGMKIDRKDLIYRLTDLYYDRNDIDFKRGTFRIRGDIIDVIPAFENQEALRIEMFDDEIDRLAIIDAVSGKRLRQLDFATVYPAKLYVTSEGRMQQAMADIKNELDDRLIELRKQDKLVEAQRLEQRTLYDLEMMKEIGYCSGIENYSMHTSGRNPGERPQCLFDYFPEDYLLVIDESHVSVPQLRAMYNGDRMRKKTLVEHGFRLPSALENRPLQFEEIENLINQAVFMSATPGDWELEQSGGVFVEQVIRPTGLLDPEVEIRPIDNQIDDLIDEIRKRTAKNQKVLVTTLTKKMAEDLTDYLHNLNIKVNYIHSGVVAMERVEVIRGLRTGEYDVLVGVNLLREGLDLPEVTLVAILDADKEGFLRSERSLLQTAGRTARNVEGKVILYADKRTKSIEALVRETNRRRRIQQEYNTEHGINPETVYKSLDEILSSTSVADINDELSYRREEQAEKKRKLNPAVRVSTLMTPEQQRMLLEELTVQMKAAARDLDFELAASLRDEIKRITDDLNAEEKKTAHKKINKKA